MQGAESEKEAPKPHLCFNTHEKRGPPTLGPVDRATADRAVSSVRSLLHTTRFRLGHRTGNRAEQYTSSRGRAMSSTTAGPVASSSANVRPSRRLPSSPAPDSLDYALLSGLAGGIAGELRVVAQGSACGSFGSSTGCVAKTSVAPLDRVKILFQTRSPDYARYAGESHGPPELCGMRQRHNDRHELTFEPPVGTWTGVFRASKDIYAETGVRGLLQGHSATLLRIFPYAAIKFMAYDKFHIVSSPYRSAV